MGQHFLTFRTWYDQCPRAWLSVLLEGKTGPLGRPCLPQSPGLLAALLPALGAWLAQHRVCAQSEQTVRVLGHWGWSERGKQKGQSPGPALLPGGPPPPGLSGEAPPSTAQTNPHRCLPRLAPQEDQVWRAGPGEDPASSLPLESSCLKYLTFLFNFLFSLLGLLALAIGLWGLAGKGSLGSSGGAALPEDPLLGLVLGGLAVSAVSLAGCLGALCENACLLHCFSGGLIAFLALEAVVGALLVAFWGPLQDGLESTLHAAITHYQDDPDLHFLIDQVQLGLQCCGVSSYRDWTWNLDFNCSSPAAQACSLPASCCLSPGEDGAAANDPCGFGAPGLDEGAALRRVHLGGCGPALRRWLRAEAPPRGPPLLLPSCGLQRLTPAFSYHRQLARAPGLRPTGGRGRLGGGGGARYQVRPTMDLSP
uniref:Tetraspanin-10 n=1 Tax=Ursus maritimus TaxID=29073 RepID=A0A452UMR3_URSMA